MTGMIKNIPSEPQNNLQSSENSTNTESITHQSSKWFIEDGVEAPFERPSFVPEKAKSLKSLVDMYSELEKRNTLINQVAPDEYDWGVHKDVFDLENNNIKEFVTKAKDLKISQQAFGAVTESMASYMKSLMPNADEEIKKLGDNAQARLDAVQKWSSNHLSDKALSTLSQISNTADVVELMDEIRQLHGHLSSQVPSGSSHTETFRPLSKEEVDNEMFSNYKRYNEDKNFREEINRKYRMVYGEE